MAPSIKFILLLISALVAFAAVQPSAAARAAHDAAAPAPAAALPKFSLPPLISCIPFLPQIPFLPCYSIWPTPAPPRPALTECWSPLAELTPCAGYLSKNSVVPVPPPACCDGLNDVVNYAAICFCHYSNGDVANVLKVPLNLTRAFELPPACNSFARLEGFANCSSDPTVPPLTPPSPPPSAPAGKGGKQASYMNTVDGKRLINPQHRVEEVISSLS
ncbi:hypothetical protein ACP4OV_012253 [Aristida adscensionis]